MTDHLTWMQTYTGGKFQYGALNKTFVADIAGPLSRIPRFCGASRQSYSVLQHSFYVAQIARALNNGSSGPLDEWEVAVHALLHDAHEAFTGDIPLPLKNFMKSKYNFSMRLLESEIDDSIYFSFGLERPTGDMYELIKKADYWALKCERKIFMQSQLEWPLDTDDSYDIRVPSRPDYEMMAMEATDLCQRYDTELTACVCQVHIQRMQGLRLMGR